MKAAKTKNRATGILAAMIASIAVQPARAESAAKPACPSDATSAPYPFEAWTVQSALKGGVIHPGEARILDLIAIEDLTFSVAPERPPAAGSTGAVLTLRVDQQGRYAVALGAKGWIDMVRAGLALSSVGHGPAPACTSISKVVDFDLLPGDYIVQISGVAAPGATVLVARRD